MSGWLASGNPTCNLFSQYCVMRGREEMAPTCRGETAARTGLGWLCLFLPKRNVWAHREEACRERRRLKGRDGGCDGASPVPVKEEPWKIGPRWQSVLAAAACGAPCATSDRVRQLAWSSRLRVKEASPKRPPDLNLGILLGHGPGAPCRVVRRT